jgi:hypothetical protein
VARPFHHDCNCIEGNVKKKRQQVQLKEKKVVSKKISEQDVIKIGTDKGPIKINADLDKSDI